ncbi:DMT family transporter [Solicola gregarius]|uniref:DMT family transporter n=1 Tax=Solicola gregarius TaxID=2908642 RepID=A0AA46TF83_9ACTN|nr:DMT family transporter [Solicola gregarius]UYM04231.1 DMT family transporter [Solicola gregarius]
MKQHADSTLSVTTVILYASGYPFGALTLGYLSPFLLILLRFALSAILLWAVVAFRRTPMPRAGSLAPCVVAGVLVQGVQFLGLYWGMSHGVSPGIAALVIAMNPVATAIIGRFFLGHREDVWGLVALAAAVAGILLATLPTVLADPAIGIGIVTTLMGLAGLSVGSILQSRIRGGVDPIVFTAIGVTASLPLAAVACLTTDARLEHPLRAGLLLAVVVVVSAVGTTLYAACVRRMGPRTAAILFAVIPALASVFAWAINDDPIAGPTFIALLLGALACTAQARSRRSGGQPRAMSMATDA